MKVVNEDRQSIFMLEFLQQLMLIEDQNVRRLDHRFSDTENSFVVQTLTHQEKQYYEKNLLFFFRRLGLQPRALHHYYKYLFLKKS